MLLGIEDILCELASEEEMSNGHHGFPPGFRFHPTDEELITFYLASKVFNGSFCPVDIPEVDLNKSEPWDLPDVAKMGKKEWYFYSLRDRKYPTGLRTNRATGTGYWKATGKDKEIHNAGSGALIGMKKTLVFYIGRAPRGEKTKWVMHEYRLHGHFFCRAAAKEEWVICRVYHKTWEKKNVVMNETRSQLEPAPAMDRNESFLHHLIDTQLLPSQDSLQLFHNNPLQSELVQFPAFNFQQGSMLIKSLITSEEQLNSNCKEAKTTTNIPRQGKMELSFPCPLPGADDLEWFQELQQAAYTNNNHNSLVADTISGESCSSYSRQMTGAMDFSQGGCLQMVVDPNWRIPSGDSWALDARPMY